jgi:hypothetical protein
MSHHLDDRIDFADMREKLVPQALPFARTFYDPSDIDKLDGRRNDLLGLGDYRKLCESIIFDIDNPYIRFDRTERKVGCICSIGFGECVEEC